VRDVFFVFMVWVFPVVVVGILVVLATRRRRDGERDPGPATTSNRE
jgi:cytochrome c-type biogenesis protein CcmH/NrfF